jgi:CheY-like chemotaxis protein
LKDSEDFSDSTGNIVRILLVDDEDLVRNATVRMLEQLGYEVDAVSNGPDAVEHYEKHGTKIDLVMIDMLMPGMDGRGCFKALKGIDPDVRAVFSTGCGIDDDDEPLDEGVRGIILKPYNTRSLSKVLRAALEE